MATTAPKSIFASSPREHRGAAITPLRGVGQDKSASLRDRANPPQPAAASQVTRSSRPLTGQPSTKHPRSRKRSTARQTVPITAWVSPALKAELQRLADQEDLSLSTTAATFLTAAVRQ